MAALAGGFLDPPEERDVVADEFRGDRAAAAAARKAAGNAAFAAGRRPRGDPTPRRLRYA